MRARPKFVESILAPISPEERRRVESFVEEYLTRLREGGVFGCEYLVWNVFQRWADESDRMEVYEFRVRWWEKDPVHGFIRRSESFESEPQAIDFFTGLRLRGVDARLAFQAKHVGPWCPYRIRVARKDGAR